MFDRSSRLSQNSLPGPDGQEVPPAERPGSQRPLAARAHTAHHPQKTNRQMKRKDKSGGRPRIEEGDKKKAVISFRTDQITRRHLEKLEKQADRIISEVIREAIRNSVIDKSAYTEYLHGKTHLTKSDLLGMIVINTHVMEAIPKNLVGIIRNLYKVTTDINAIVKKLRIMEYYDLVDGYYKLFNQIFDINKSLTGFINSYRNGKEVQL